MLRRELLLSSLAFGTLPAPLRADSRPSANTTDPRLRDAIVSRLESGGQIVLAGGDYGVLHINRPFPPASPLAIVAADPADPPRFTGLDVYESRNVALEGLFFDYTFAPGDEPYHYAFRVWRSRDVSIRSCLFDGDVARDVSPADDGFPAGYGLSVRDVTGFGLDTCEVRGFQRGLHVAQTSDLRVVGNHIHGMRSDGMNFAEVTNALIANNRIYDFRLSRESGDHPDMIQFWTAGTSNPSRNVTIRDNLLYLGNENPTQSIFIRNELVDTGQAGSEMFYQDLLIENNFILNSHLHGVTVGETEGLVIRNNTLVRDQAASGPDLQNELYRPRINIKPTSRDVAILRNITADISGYEGQSDWHLAENLIVQDIGRLRPNFYGVVFVGGNWSDPAAYAPRPRGPLDGTGIGAQLR